MWPQLVNMLSWWQWTILAAIPPALVALYFLKRKRRPLEVPSTYLWRKSVEDFHVNSLWQRLRRNLLLWLQLAAVALAILALLRPGWRGVHLADERLIFLIDNSASMQATDVKPSRLEEAKRRVGQLIDQMGAEAAMLISFSDNARVEQPFTRDRAALRRSLTAIQPTQRRTSLSEALPVAAGLANATHGADGRDDGSATAHRARLLIFSDGKFDDVASFTLGNLDPVYVPIHTPHARNIAITAFSVERQPQQPARLQAFAQVANFSDFDATVEVELFCDDQANAIAADRLAVPAGRNRGLTFDLDAIRAQSLRLKIDTADDLAVDNEAWAAINPPRRARVLLVTPGNRPLELALSTGLASAWASVETAKPKRLNDDEYQRQAQSGGYDLVVYDRCQPRSMPSANTLFLGALPPGGIWKAKPVCVTPQIYDTQTAHPLMQGLEMSGVQIVEATPLIPPSGSQVLIDADVGPLLAIAPREDREDVVLAFPLVYEDAVGRTREVLFGSNWHNRPSFPIFAWNLLRYLGRSTDFGVGEASHPGQPITVRTDRQRQHVTIRTPAGGIADIDPTRPGEFTFPGTEVQGIYTAELSKSTRRYAVNLGDRAESDIRAKPVPSLRIGYTSVNADPDWETGRQEIWRALLGATLAILVAEWYIYSHRISREPRRWGLRRKSVRPDSPQ